MLDRNVAHAAGWDASNGLKRLRGLAAWTDVEATLGCAVTNYLMATFEDDYIAERCKAEADECAAWLVGHGVTCAPNGSWRYAAPIAA
jgi:hypothetical protein